LEVKRNTGFAFFRGHVAGLDPVAQVGVVAVAVVIAVADIGAAHTSAVDARVFRRTGVAVATRHAVFERHLGAGTSGGVTRHGAARQARPAIEHRRRAGLADCQFEVASLFAVAEVAVLAVLVAGALSGIGGIDVRPTNIRCVGRNCISGRVFWVWLSVRVGARAAVGQLRVPAAAIGASIGARAAGVGG
jgi:hypothetical protein